jgi:hypothetical protein
MSRAQQMASMVLPTLTCNRSVASLQTPDFFEADLHWEGGDRYNSLGEITSSEGTKVGMVEDTPSHAQRAETSGGDIASLGFVDGSKVAALGCFRKLKDNPNRQLTEPTFHTVKDVKTRNLVLIAKDIVGEQAGIINMVHCEDGSIRRELDKDPGKIHYKKLNM